MRYFGLLLGSARQREAKKVGSAAVCCKICAKLSSVSKSYACIVGHYYKQGHSGKLVFLGVAKTNKAMGLYAKIGFQIVDLPSKNGSTDVVMAMPLSLLGENVKKFTNVRMVFFSLCCPGQRHPEGTERDWIYPLMCCAT